MHGASHETKWHWDDDRCQGSAPGAPGHTWPWSMVGQWETHRANNGAAVAIGVCHKPAQDPGGHRVAHDIVVGHAWHPRVDVCCLVPCTAWPGLAICWNHPSKTLHTGATGLESHWWDGQKRRLKLSRFEFTFAWVQTMPLPTVVMRNNWKTISTKSFRFFLLCGLIPAGQRSWTEWLEQALNRSRLRTNEFPWWCLITEYRPCLCPVYWQKLLHRQLSKFAIYYKPCWAKVLNSMVCDSVSLKRATSCELFSGIALTSGAISVLSPPLPQKQNRQRRIHKARSAPPINERAYPQGLWLTPWGKWERGAQT